MKTIKAYWDCDRQLYYVSQYQNARKKFKEVLAGDWMFYSNLQFAAISLGYEVELAIYVEKFALK